ncbi:transcriptional regulator [Streptomyces genisteinicus]|uniref:Transcriptional regulator n=1 Tax=Streptomyces genisteinicus TaxID=2768068 RepID=A0A7H0HZM9_9ACTN|nr:transcriptional regulator [Streptomyces genisteinicus]QNP65995.1 transcriptional regulator [Streptomyces genisteinicus]
MARSAGNVRLKAARLAAGYPSQQALAQAMSRHGLTVGVRQVRRWESETPPWPHPACQRVLTELLGQDMADLGFTSSTGRDSQTPGHRHETPMTTSVRRAGGSVHSQASRAVQPATAAHDYAAVTRAHRHLYWSVAPATLHPTASAHAVLGCALLPETAGAPRQLLAAALSETYLLCGRMEFFDLRQPETAHDTYLRALQAAGEADDQLLGAAVLAHMAFIPGWSGRRDEAAERMVAARTYARRGQPSALFLAWLDAVEAECETRCGNVRTALHLINHAEDILGGDSENATPDWLDWFTPVRLAAFKGNTQLKAGHLPQARTTLTGVLEDLPSEDGKQRSVILGDLAAVEAAAENAQEACGYALRALEQLETSWYATGIERVRDVRRQLVPWQHEVCVRDLDEKLYGWGTTLSALSG